MSRKVDLSRYHKAGYYPGRNGFIRALWYITNVLFFKTSLCTWYSLKRGLLRAYGAQIGKRVVIKPCVNIKYPWHLSVGDNSWIGEEVWIDNLADVEIGRNCCVSISEISFSVELIEQAYDLVDELGSGLTLACKDDSVDRLEYDSVIVDVFDLAESISCRVSFDLFR